MAAESSTGRVSSSALESRLAWKVEGRYGKIRQDLVKQGLIRAFPGGAGGALEPASKAASTAAVPLRAFVSYSHADAELKNELLKHLEPLRRLGLVEHWHDGDMSAGEEWEKVIWNRLRSAELIILLVTVDFINSEYCYDKELSAAVERHKAGKARLIPVIGRSCLWQDLPFGQIQAALGGKAVSSQQDPDEALTLVAKEVRRVAEELRSTRAAAA